MAIIRAYSFRFPVAIDTIVGQAGLEQALSTLPIGDGIAFHRIRGLFENGRLIQVELEIGDPVTIDRIDLGRRRLEDLLSKVLASKPHQTGLDARDPDELFERELDKITSATGRGGLADFFSDLRGAVLVAGAAAVLLLVLVLRGR